MLAVEVDERADELAARLAAAGVRSHEDGRTLLVDLRDEATYDVIRDAAADLGLGLIRLEQRRHHVEDVFRDARGVPPEPLGAASPSPAPGEGRGGGDRVAAG